MADQTVADLLDLQPLANADATAFTVRMKPGAARNQLARLLATEIARGLLEPSDGGFAAWCQRRDRGPAHNADRRDELVAYVLSDFSPSAAEAAEGSTRLRGAVVEHLWVAIADALNGGWGTPMHVERDHFSVIDHGADGVALYDAGTDELRFRLWESKRHSSDDSVTDTVTDAANQLAKEGVAARYLARISKPLQSNDDPRIRLLAGRIVRLWTSRDDRSAVGVSIGRSTGAALPARPFIGLMRKFTYLNNDRREGVIIEIDDLNAFADEVRAWLEQGIN